MIEFSPYKWKCPICGSYHRIRRIWRDGEYELALQRLERGY
jgi:hypothetical protein